MNIQLETPTRMVLKDDDRPNFFKAIILLLLGVSVIYFFRHPIGVFIGAVLLIIGSIALTKARRIKTVIDKSTGKCSTSTWSILKRDFEEFEINAIKELELSFAKIAVLNRNRNIHGRQRYSFYYKYILSFLIVDGSRISTEFAKVSPSIIMDFLSPQQEKIHNDAKQIADFIGVPLKEILPPTASEALETAKEKIFGKITE